MGQLFTKESLSHTFTLSGCRSTVVQSNVNVKCKAVPLPPYKRQGERKYSSCSLLASAIDGVTGQRRAPAALYPRERTTGTQWTGDWVGLRAGLDTEARGKILSPLAGIEPQSPSCPVRSQTLYWLSYPAHTGSLVILLKVWKESLYWIKSERL
jgi:hypothetical protein